MSNISTVEARNKFSDLINRAAFGKERIVLSRRGKDLVAVVPIEDVEFLQELENRLDLEEARKALKESGKKGNKPWVGLKAELGL